VKISCPACQAKYSIADEKVTDRLAKIRCRKCGATIVIDGKTSPANVYTAAGEAPDAGAASAVEHDSGSSYSVDFGEGDQRNMTVAEIVTAYNAGQISAETYLWADGFADWKALGEVDEIVDALHAASPGPAAASPAFPASATATPSPWAAPAATAPRAAARPVRGASADLFGGIEHAGSEEDVTTSAPEHGAGGHAAPAAAASASGAGARNESSVLFSLSALTSASSPMAATRPSSRPISSAASRDDSGLIDLKALTAAATRTEALPAAPSAAPLMAPPLGLASPLGLGSPLGGGFAASAEPTHGGSGKSKTGLYIGGALVLCALIVGVAIVLKPPPPAPPPPVAVETPPAPAPTPSPAAVVTAAPPTTGTVEEPAPSAKPAAPVAVHHASGGGAVAPKKPATAAAGGDTPAAPAAPKPAKRSSCGCAPGDLMCNMQCSAK
jgi:predicted Zn finger-like uncharacterized protein